jgi:hypothetical protein
MQRLAVRWALKDLLASGAAIVPDMISGRVVSRVGSGKKREREAILHDMNPPVIRMIQPRSFAPGRKQHIRSVNTRASRSLEASI